MTEYLLAAYLGIVQGLTEFLPVSSSGHLALSHIIFHHFGLTLPTDDLFFDLLLHLGTLIVVLGFYRREILQFIQEWTGIGGAIQSSVPTGVCKEWTGYILVATFVTAALSLPFKKQLEESFSEPYSMGVSWIFTGMLLILSGWLAERTPDDRTRPITLKTAIFIGVLQAVSVLPAVSRSGATIAAALILGVRKQEAVTFSFLISIPAILGAVLIQSRTVQEVAWAAPLVGVVFAMVFGWFALALLVKWVIRGRLTGFSLYCFAIGILTVALAAMGWL
jgi:undecaprenyl-diphosphatase